MDHYSLCSTAGRLLAEGKGILAIDESVPTCGRRFAEYGIENSEQNRREYRAMLLTTPGLSESVSGAILHDEGIRMRDRDGTPFPDMMRSHGLLVGIKVDTGAKDLAGWPGEKVTEGLDGLRERLAEYFDLGARFAKWRAVVAIDGQAPTRACLEANAHALARYAALCQEAGLVPIVEPEVLFDGRHDIETCYRVTADTLAAVFAQLRVQGVFLEALILKASMVLPGNRCTDAASPDDVARWTLRCLHQTVPEQVPGVAFLSGGQRCEQATEHLNAINAIDGGRAPWRLTFSYARALQQPALAAWRGAGANIGRAQTMLMHRAGFNSKAAAGRYHPDQERDAA